jgi:predicted dehydrogenase
VIPERVGQRPLGVGIIGAGPAGWAMRSHVPAIRAIPGLRLAAVSTSRGQTLSVAMEASGADRGFLDHEELVNDDAVDLVVVAVRVPEHRRLVDSALRAGTHVYCEWPLGVSAAQASEMAAAAASFSGPHAVGLQARASPVLRHVRDLIAGGFIGTVESASFTAFSSRGAHPVTPSKEYLFDERTGASLLTIEGGHLVDAAAYLLGDFHDGASRTSIRRPLVPRDEGDAVHVTAADTFVASMLTGGGAPVTFHLAQGTQALVETEALIVGSDGALRLRTIGAGGIQMAPLRLWGADSRTGPLRRLRTPARYSMLASPPAPPAANVAHALAGFAEDIRRGESSTLDFAHAVRLHRTLEALWEAGIAARSR